MSDEEFEPCCKEPDLRLEASQHRGNLLDLVIVCRSCYARFVVEGCYPERVLFEVGDGVHSHNVVDFCVTQVEPQPDGTFRHFITIDTKGKA